jgi:glutathione-independent formaldehyde dehydrogenase
MPGCCPFAACVVGIAGVYAETDLAPAPQGSADGSLRIHWATLFNKGVSLHWPHPRPPLHHPVRDLVVSGRAQPGRIVTHHGPLEDAPDLYQRFDRRADGVIKAVLRPG